SSASRLLAKRLGWRVFETGGLYRAVAWAALKAGIDPADPRAMGRLCSRLGLTLAPVRRIGPGGPAGWRIRIKGRRLIHELRDDAVTATASRVAALPVVRRRLLTIQRTLIRQGAKRGGVVMEGRDIGTVVCPAATAKFFLDADPSVRGRRRFRELPGGRRSARQVLSAIRERDQRDQGRPVAPLRAAEDAVRIDTTGLTLDQVVDKMMAVLDGRGILLSFDRLHRVPHR
ncbi:MAG: (d)CMP kinase, partial [Nitrospirae bacterium]|nr:(d)CMP kinase [Nitrospirota bacterium]